MPDHIDIVSAFARHPSFRLTVSPMPLFRNPFGLFSARSRHGAASGSGKRRSRYYHGPVSDHFDGVRFFDPHGMAPKSFGDLLRWRSAGSGVPWPRWAPSPYRDRPPARVAGLRISFVGHASLLVQAGNLNLLIDPVWSARASPVEFAGPKRVNDPGIAFAALPPIDAVLVSHGHYDHLDLATLSRLAVSHRPR